MRIVQIITILLFVSSSFHTFGQKHRADSTLHALDSMSFDEEELIKQQANRFDPRIAGLYSAVLPGLGQAYTKNYWKIPLIYAGFYGIYYTVNTYNVDYQFHRKELLYYLADDTKEAGALTPSGFNEDQIRNRIDRARRERDYWIILGSIFYLLNIADAHIYAHLKEFDLNEKLKLSIDPNMSQSFNGMNAGFSITLQFQ